MPNGIEIILAYDPIYDSPKVRYYSRVLTRKEILEIYNNGKPLNTWTNSLHLKNR